MRGFAAVLLVLSLSALGCKQKPITLPPATANGASLDMARFTQTMASSTSKDVKKGVSDFYTSVRYGNYTQADESLDKIAADTSLTEEQKQAVNTAKEQLKQMMAAASKPAQ